MNPPRWLLMILFRPLRLLAVCIVTGFFLLQFAMRFGKDNPNSHFFDPTEETFQKPISDLRKQKSRSWIKQMDNDFQSLSKDNESSRTKLQSLQYKASLTNQDRERESELSVVFLVAQRPKEQYLDASIGTLLMELQPVQRQRMHISVSYGGDYEDPSVLPFFRSAWLHGLTDQVIVRKLPREKYLPANFDKSADGVQLPHAALLIMPNPTITFGRHKLSSTNEGQKRGTSDYSIALEICEKRKTKHCLIVEDDVVFRENWFENFEKNLRKAEEYSSISKGPKGTPSTQQTSSPSWAYIRLFYAEKYFGWENEEVQMIVLVCTLIVGSFGLLLLWFGRIPARYAALAGVRSHPHQKMDLLKAHDGGEIHAGHGGGLFDPDEERKVGGLRGGRIARIRLPLASQLIMTMMVLYICILFILSGRNLVYKIPDGISEMNSRGCCTQAIVYHSRVISGLKNHLRVNIGERPHHNLINQYVDRNQKIRIAISPPLVQHIGVGSAREMVDENYLTSTPLWSFAFERQLANVRI